MAKNKKNILKGLGNYIRYKLKSTTQKNFDLYLKCVETQADETYPLNHAYYVLVCENMDRFYELVREGRILFDTEAQTLLGKHSWDMQVSAHRAGKLVVFLSPNNSKLIWVAFWLHLKDGNEFLHSSGDQSTSLYMDAGKVLGCNVYWFC